MNIFFHQTILGKIGIAEESGVIKHLLFENEKTIPDAQIKESDVIKEAFNQLDAYFTGNLRVFNLPLDPEGTDYMKKIWNLLKKIPYGKTASYKDIAAASGNDKAARAVGLANNRNPVPIFIPCHRVIGSNGNLVGFGGGLDIKKKLLDLEKNNAGS